MFLLFESTRDVEWDKSKRELFTYIYISTICLCTYIICVCVCLYEIEKSVISLERNP